MERLRALGYSDEDLDTQFDDKAWKWKQLMKQTRPVSDKGLLSSQLLPRAFLRCRLKVWQNIKAEH